MITDLLIGMEGSSCGLLVKAMDCEIVVNEFELQSHYNVHFRTNTLWKDINLLTLTAIG